MRDQSMIHGRRTAPVLMLIAMLIGLIWPVAGVVSNAEASGATLYVSTDGDDTKNCDSIANRCQTVQRALDMSSDGDTIKVSAGTYTDPDTASAGYVAIATTEVSMIGGYDASFTEPPDATANVTTIDAQSIGGVLQINYGPLSEYSGFVLDGFTITGGDSSTSGGGIAVLGSSAVTVSHSRILSNHSDMDGGGIFVNGGSAQIIGNFIDGNTATWSGGLRLINDVQILLQENIISNNSASISAGGVDIECCAEAPAVMAKLIGNQILNNDGASLGGGVRVSSTTAELINNIIANNSATDGSGLFVEGTLTHNAVVDLAHNTFYGDLAEGSGIEADTYTAIQLSNNIVAHHSTGIVNASPSDSSVSADYTLFYGNSTHYGTDVTVTNAIIADPLFLDPPGDDFHLRRGSPARDAGSSSDVVSDPVTDDIDGDVRDAAPDLGADEYISPDLLLLTLFRSPASITKGSAASGPNQWFARVALNDDWGDPGQAFHYVVWLHVPTDWTLPWATQYSFTGDFSNGPLSADWTAQTWVQDTGSCPFGGMAESGFKWRAFRGPEEALPALIDRVGDLVNLRGGLGVPPGETSDAYGGVRVVVGTYYDSDQDGAPDRYGCDHISVTTITIP